MDPDRFSGALLGLAVGDAVGTTVEFRPPGSFAPVIDMTGGGPFDLPAGAWTDDTAMALCLAESLLECRGFDPADQLRRYVRWYREGHWSSTGTCFDIGNATRAALERFERTGEPFPGDAAPDAAGNGPLMKLAPIAMAFASAPADAVVHAADAARTTHGAPEAADAAAAFAALLVTELAGVAVTPPGVWSEAAEALHTPRTNGVRGALASRREPPAIRGTGYVVDALEAALWAVRTTSSFEAAILAAVNLGDDADTTAAIAGQLAGARYGAGAIPAGWLEKLVLSDTIGDIADRLWRFGSVDVNGRP